MADITPGPSSKSPRERARTAFRNICLVLTGYFPENLSDTAETNKKCAEDIITHAIIEAVEEATKELKSFHNQCQPNADMRNIELFKKNEELQSTLKRYEEALRKISRYGWEGEPDYDGDQWEIAREALSQLPTKDKENK